MADFEGGYRRVTLDGNASTEKVANVFKFPFFWLCSTYAVSLFVG